MTYWLLNERKWRMCGNDGQSKGGNLRQPKYSGVASYADLTYANSTTQAHPKHK
jgi:hypothetical protein